MYPENGGGYSFGRFTLNLDRAALQADGVAVDLRPKSFDVLRYLVEHAGKIASKDEIVAAVWPNIFVSDDSLAQCIRDIRKALNDDGEQFIKTVPRRGYLFVAAVEPLGQSTAPARDVLPAEASARRRWPIAIMTGVPIALVLVVLAAWGSGWFASAPVSPARDARLTIAVLPFASLSEDSGEEWLADGIAEDIMTAVSRFRDLTVIARNSSFRFRGEVDVREVGKQLNADYILQGSVRRRGDQLRVTAQLVDARTGTTRWSERYDRPFADVFAVQDEIAEGVARPLAAHAHQAASVRLHNLPAERLEAYQLVLRARAPWQASTREGTFETQRLAEKAIAIDPNYAAAWELLARARVHLYLFPYSEHMHSPDMLRQARAAAEKAVALDPDYSMGHATLGNTLLWAREHDASLAAFQKALALNRNDGIAQRLYAFALSLSGRHEESIQYWQSAERSDPFLSAVSYGIKSIPHIALGQYREALALARTCFQRSPKMISCSWYRAVAATALDLEEEAAEAANRVLEINPRFTISETYLKIVPFSSEETAAKIANYMRRAGLPE